jgi:hypothetical protein
MTIADLKVYLGGYKDDDQVIALWWDYDSFYDKNLSTEQWKQIVQNIEEYSFDRVHEVITEAVNLEIGEL